MKKNDNVTRTGLKRKVSPITSVVVIIGVIVIIFAIFLGVPALKKAFAPKIGLGEIGTDIETKGRNAPRKLAQERIGAQLTIDVDPKTGGLKVGAINPDNTTSNLKPGDYITAINGAPVKYSKGVMTIARETFKFEVGQQINLDIVRDGQPMQIQITRLASTPGTGDQGPGGMGGRGM